MNKLLTIVLDIIKEIHEKGVVLRYVEAAAGGNEINSQEKAKAKSAYRQIENNGNAEGLRFLKEL